MLDDDYQAESANAEPPDEPPDDEPEAPSQYERDRPEPVSRAPREAQRPVFEDPSGAIPQQADGTYSRLTPQQVDERQMLGRLPETARQHLAVQQLALSQAEKMNLQRLQNGMGTVDKMLARGQIDQEQADEMKAKILNIKGPLERRAAQAVAQQHEQQSQLVQHQVAQAASMDALNAKFHAMSAQDRATPVDLGDGRKGVMVQTSPGKWQFHELKDEKADQEEKKQEKITAHLEKREKDWRTVYDHAVKTVDQKIADKREAEADANKDAEKKGTGVREHSDFNRDKMIADELKARGHEGTIEEHRAAERVKLGLKPQAEVNPINPPGPPAEKPYEPNWAKPLGQGGFRDTTGEPDPMEGLRDLPARNIPKNAEENWIAGEKSVQSKARAAGNEVAATAARRIFFYMSRGKRLDQLPPLAQKDFKYAMQVVAPFLKD